MVIASYGRVSIDGDGAVSVNGSGIGEVYRHGIKYYLRLFHTDGFPAEVLMDLSMAMMRYEINTTKRN